MPMIYCVLCGHHVPGHDMVQARGAPVCSKHSVCCDAADPPLIAHGPGNKSAPGVDTQG